MYLASMLELLFKSVLKTAEWIKSYSTCCGVMVAPSAIKSKSRSACSVLNSVQTTHLHQIKIVLIDLNPCYAEIPSNWQKRDIVTICVAYIWWLQEKPNETDVLWGILRWAEDWNGEIVSRTRRKRSIGCRALVTAMNVAVPELPSFAISSLFAFAVFAILSAFLVCPPKASQSRNPFGGIVILEQRDCDGWLVANTRWFSTRKYWNSSYWKSKCFGPRLCQKSAPFKLSLQAFS